MDRILEIIQLQRDSKEKKYCQKAEKKSKALKEITGVPQIDSLSRKLAEVVTQRELASLGIVPEKPSRASVLLKKKPKPLAQSSEKSAEVLLGMPEIEKLNQSLITETKDTQKETPEKPDFSGKNQVKPIISPGRQSGPANLESESDEFLKAAQTIQAFQDELQREYPELCLNAEDDSSVHTNDLYELEEACKEFELDQKTGEKELPGRNDLPPQMEQEVSNKELVDEIRGIFNKPQDLKVVKSCFSRQSRRITQRSSAGLGSWDKGGRTDTTDLTSRTPEVNKEVAGIHRKSESLRIGGVGVKRHLPRCHVNLKSAKMSQIYFNSLVPEGGKLKFDSKIVDADVLRALLIKEIKAEGEKKRENFYEKNETWLRNKENRLGRMRKIKESLEFDGCTFEPELGRKKKVQKCQIFRTMDNGVSEKNEGGSEKERKGLRERKKEVWQYKGISPSEQKVGYDAGGYGKRVESLGRPLVSYRSINELL